MQQSTTIDKGDPIAPIEADSTQTAVQNQTVFEDTSTVVKTESKNQLEKLFDNFNPFPDKSPMELLTRAVKIETVNWSSGSTFWTFEPLLTIVTASPLMTQLLGNLSTIYGMFRYLRTKFKITVKLNSTPYHQGTLIASWVPPMVSPTNYTFPKFACGNHGHILSASQQDQIEFTIPYLNCDPFWDLKNYASNLNYGPTFILTVLNALATSNGAVADNVPITIWIQMVDPVVSGIVPVGYNYTSTVLTTTTKTTPTTSTSKVSKVQLEEVVYESQSGKNQKPIHSKESVVKDDQGLTASGAIDIVRPFVQSIPFGGALLQVAESVFKSLDKPTDEQVTTLTQTRAYRGFTTVQGVYLGESLGALPITKVTKDIGMVSSDMTVSQYAQLPNWFRSATVSNAGLVFSQRVHPCIYNNVTNGGRDANPDFLGFAAACYAYWKGSIKFLFHFCGTAFYSCTFRITVYYGSPLPVLSERAAIEDGVGCYSKVITVRGDAWCEIQVPYLHKRAWALTYTPQQVADQNLDDPCLMLEALTPVSGSNTPGAAAYYVNVFRAGGEDIEFAQLNNALFIDPDVVYESQSSLIDKFQKPFDPIIPGARGVTEDNVCMGEKAGSITDVCKRFVQQKNGCQTGNAGRTYQTYPWSEDPTLNIQPLYWWSRGFAYWRGAMRLEGVTTGMWQATLHTKTISGSTSTWSPGDPVMIADNGVHISCEVPYYSRAAFAPTLACNSIATNLANYELPPVATVVNFSAATQLTFIAFGDDAAYYHPIAPIPFNVGTKQSAEVIRNGLSIASTKGFKIQDKPVPSVRTGKVEVLS